MAIQNYTQIEIFYISDRGYVAEWWIREQQVPEQRTLNGNGSMSPNAWKAGVGSRLTSYWPSVIVQDDTSQLQEIYYNGSWSQNNLGLACQNHSAFAEMPVSIKGGLTGAENFVYQRNDQKLFIEARKDSTASASTGKFGATSFIPLRASNLTLGQSNYTRHHYAG
jgi:hypothetical protein